MFRWVLYYKNNTKVYINSNHFFKAVVLQMFAFYLCNYLHLNIKLVNLSKNNYKKFSKKDYLLSIKNINKDNNVYKRLVQINSYRFTIKNSGFGKIYIFIIFKPKLQIIKYIQNF